MDNFGTDSNADSQNTEIKCQGLLAGFAGGQHIGCFKIPNLNFVFFLKKAVCSLWFTAYVVMILSHAKSTKWWSIIDAKDKDFWGPAQRKPICSKGIKIHKNTHTKSNIDAEWAYGLFTWRHLWNINNNIWTFEVRIKRNGNALLILSINEPAQKTARTEWSTDCVVCIWQREALNSLLVG